MAAGFNSGSAALPYVMNGKFLGNVYLGPSAAGQSTVAFHSLPISGGVGFTGADAVALDTAAYLSASFAGQSGSIIQALNFIKGAIDAGNNAAGSNTQVQYNNAGEFGASANFVFDGTDVTLGASAGTTKLQLRDSAIFVQSSVDGQLDLAADGEVQIATAKLDVDASSDFNISGGAASAITTTAGDLTIGGATQAGAINITSAENASDAITLNASNAAGGIDLAVAGSDIISIDADSVDVIAAAAVNIASTTESAGTSSGALVVGGGVGIGKDLSVGDDLGLLSDGGILSFGADSDVTLTHVADTGLQLNAAMQLMFRDSALHIASPSDGNIRVTADVGIGLSGSVGVSGDLFVGTNSGGGVVAVGNIAALGASNANTYVSGTELRLNGTTAAGAGSGFALQVSGGVLMVAEL